MTVTTQPITSSNGKVAAVPDDLIWRLSVDQYHQMIRAGILTEDDPVELLEGWLVQKMSKNPPHSLVNRLIRKALERLALSGWFVDSQEPITTRSSEPEPDVALIRGNDLQYHDHHPGPQEVALVVEVADSSLQRDRTTKKRIYAEAGIPVYWIVNLSENQIEVYTEPSGPAAEPDYRRRQDYGPAELLSVVIEGREVGQLSVRDLLP